MNSKTFGPAIRKRLWVGLLLVLGLVMLLTALRYLRPEPKATLPVLGLMTTLPLQWSEGGVEAAVAVESAPHPVYTRLTQAYRVLPIDDLDTLEKSRISVLMLAQPRALSPAELVKLDSWVRHGGHVLILADPALQWGSLYPLGDSRRPLFTSLLSPLFSHWGVELVLPINDSQPLVVRDVGNFRLRTRTPGQWQTKPGGDGGSCSIARTPIIADCEVGQGRAFLIADADLLDSINWEGQGVRTLTGSDEFDNMRWVEDLLFNLRPGSGKAGDFVGR